MGSGGGFGGGFGGGGARLGIIETHPFQYTWNPKKNSRNEDL